MRAAPSSPHIHNWPSRGTGDRDQGRTVPGIARYSEQREVAVVARSNRHPVRFPIYLPTGHRRRFSSAYTHESVTVLKIAACLGMSTPNIFTTNQLTRKPEPEPDTGKAAPAERDYDIATRFPCIINNTKVHAHRPRPAHMTGSPAAKLIAHVEGRGRAGTPRRCRRRELQL